MELISYAPDGGYKQLIVLCQRDPTLRTVVLTTEEEREEWTIRYQELMAHYGCDPTTNNAGIAHENGDVEQSHFRFKDALDQALWVRGSRDLLTDKPTSALCKIWSESGTSNELPFSFCME